MKLVSAALKNPYAVVVFMLFLVVLGFTALRRIPADLLPIFKTPAIQVVTLYPGMPPVVVEKDISSRMQRWTGQSVGIDHQEARSMLGVSIVRDFFREDISAESAMSQVTSLAVSDMFYLPPGTLPPMVMPFDPTASVPICLVAVSADDTMSEKELYDVAYYDMRNRLQAIQGVIAPAVYGGVLRRILTYVDRDKLEALNMSPLDIAKGIRASNPFVPVGSATLDGSEFFIRSNAMVEFPDDLNDIPIRVDNGVPIRIRDIGHAEDSHQIQSNIVRINGQRQAYIPIYRQPGSNTLEIVKLVRERSAHILAQIKDERPKAKASNLSLDVVLDQSVAVRASINTLSTSAIIGAILVALVVFMFLWSVTSTIVVLLAIPLSIAGAVAGLYFTGDTINAMTLGGLSLAIGILVDQSIVVMENITRHMRMGKSAMKASLDGASEVATPVLVSTMTFMVVFFPVVYLTGLAKFLFSPLALAVIFATLTSYVLAMTFIPAAASRLLKPGAATGGRFDRIAAMYRGIAAQTIRRRWIVLATAALLFGGAAFGLNNIGTELFPQVDAGQFMVLVRAKPGTPLVASEVIVQDVEAAIQGVIGEWDKEELKPESDLKLLISNIGVLYDWPAAYTPNAGPMDSFVLVQLKDTRKKSAQEYAHELRLLLPQKFPEVEFSFDTGGMMTAALNMGQPAPINIQVRGGQLDSLYLIAHQIVEEVKKIEGTIDVRIDEPENHPSLEIEVDRTKAATLGLTQEDVIKNVATAVNSSCNFLPSYWISPQNGNHYLMGAQYRQSDINSLETLENIPLTGANSTTPTLLKNVAVIHESTTPVVVTHKNITRTVNIFANVRGRDVGSIAAEIDRRVFHTPGPMRDLIERYEKQGYRVSLEGEVKAMNDSFESFFEGLIIAAVLVYLVMVAQFRSFLLPLTILLTVPLGLIGVVPVLWLTNTYLSVPAFMGLLLMIGIVVQYSILVVEFAVRRQREGVELREAILDAAQDRLRPVLMTSLTTVLALLPMAIGFGRGGEANIPLARSIIGAVLGGAVLSLFVVPSLYSVLGRWVKPTPESDLEVV